MKKLLTLTVLLIAGCSTTNFSAYDGETAITGSGGFIDFDEEGVKFYHGGLPKDKTCKPLGEITDERRKNAFYDREDVFESVAEEAAKYGANVALYVSEKTESLGTIGNTHANFYGNSANAFGTNTIVRQAYSNFLVFYCE